MRKINYVTNLKLVSQSGGWSGINFRIYSELSKYFDVGLYEGISPKPFLWEKVVSKIRRVCGFRGDF